jgi:glutamyl/glutaminyl-tRNA synthetase
VLSKRKLIELVEKRTSTAGTIRGCRRWSARAARGFTPEGFRLFAERIGVSKSDSWIDMSVLEDCMREDLNARAPRRIAVLDPVRLVIDNYPEAVERMLRAQPPAAARARPRALPFSRELWIERDDYQREPPKGYFPARARRRGAAALRVHRPLRRRRAGRRRQRHAVHCTYDPATRSGTPGADARKVRATSTGCRRARAAGRSALTTAVRRAVSPRAQPPRGPTRAEAIARHATVVRGDDVADDVDDASSRNSTTSTDSKRVITPSSSPRRLRGRAGSRPVRAPRLFRRRPRDHGRSPVFNAGDARIPGRSGRPIAQPAIARMRSRRRPHLAPAAR